MRKILFLIICSVFLISGCGSSGGGAVFFETVEVTAHCETGSPLSSDIILWKGDADNSCDDTDSEIWPDFVKVAISSKVFPVIEFEEASQVRIENVRIDYYPWLDTPSLDPLYWNLGQIVEPDETVSLSIVVMGTDQKDYFWNDPNDYNSLITEDAFYTYDVTLTFSVVEIATHTKRDVSTNLTIQVADFGCTGPEDDLICDDKCIHP
ncbi:MAG: hypothetical protein ACMUHX_10305 [bacterium]